MGHFSPPTNPLLPVLFITLFSISAVVYGQSACQGGWTQANGKCYKLVNNFNNPNNLQGFTWPAAEAYCRRLAVQDGNHDGHLVSIHSGAENSMIATMITNNAAAGPQFYWIGLTLERKVISGIVNNTVLGFDWTDISTYNYNNFDPTINPSNTGGGQATGEYCVHTAANGLWNDFNCQIWGIGNPGPGCCTPWMGAICQALPGLECNNGGQSGGVAPKCENGWYSTVGLSGCYRPFPPTLLNAYTFAQAESACQSLATGSHLVSIHSDAEMKYVTGLYNSASVSLLGPVNTFFYLGGQMNGTQLASWTDGSIVDYKGQWQAGEPNVDSSNTCTMAYSIINNQLTTTQSNGNWNDITCTLNQDVNGYRAGFVCKKPAL